MEKSISKFYQFLVDRAKEIMVDDFVKYTVAGIFIGDDFENVKDSDELVITENFMKIFSVPKEKWKEHLVIFNDFDVLSFLLLKSDLNKKEMFDVVFWLIERNIYGRIIDAKSTIVDVSALREYPFKTICNDEFNDAQDIYNLIHGDEEGSKKFSDEQLEELISVLPDFIMDISDIIQCYINIKESYFDKKNTYCEADVKLVCESLKKLDVDEIIVNNIKCILDKTIKNRLKKGTKLSRTQILSDQKDRREEYLSLRPKLESLVNIKDLMPKMYFNLEQRLEIIFLMLRLDFVESTIREFLTNCENKYLDVCIDSVNKYLDEYSKLEYYAQMRVLYDELKQLDEYYQVVCIDDDPFWKDSFSSLLDDYYNKIPNDFEYEIKEGKKRLEVQNNKKRKKIK